MPRPPASVSLDDGGCAFAHDPSLPVGTAPGHLAAGTIARHADPRTSAERVRPPHVASIPRSSAQSSLTDTDDEGRELVIVDGSGELHIRLHGDQAGTTACHSAAARHASFDLRLDVALRFVRRLRGQRVKLLPAALRLDASAEAPADPASARLRRSRAWAAARARSPTEVLALRTRPTSIGRVEGFTRPSHGQPSDPRLDRAGRTRLSRTSARRLTHSPIPPERTLLLRPPALRPPRAALPCASARSRGDTPPRKSSSTPNA